jgi:hypothetical protein
MSRSRRESQKLISQDNKRWEKLRTYKVTSSNAQRFLYKSSNIHKLLIENGVGDDCSMNYMTEKAIKFLLAKKIFSTGIWVDPELFWLSTSPDGMTLIEGKLIPVEIKVIVAEKSHHQIVNEYYGQIQLHMKVTNSEKLFLIMFFKSKNIFECSLVDRDNDFLAEFLKRIELVYFKNLPFVLLEGIDKKLVEDLINSSIYKEFCLRLNRKDCNWELIFDKKLEKKIRFKRHSIKTYDLSITSLKTAEKMEELYCQLNNKQFKPQFPNEFISEKLLWFEQQVERFWKAHKQVIGAKWVC